MNTHEFNALLKGEFVNNEFYGKYYEDSFIKIANETLEDIVVEDTINCSCDIYLENIEISGDMHFAGGLFQKIEFSNSRFLNGSGLYIKKTNIQYLNVAKKSKLELLRFGGGCKIQHVSLYDSNIDRIFITEKCEFIDFSITQTNIKNGLMIWNGIFKNLKVSNNSVGDGRVTYISTLDFKIENFNLSEGASVDKIYLRRGICDSIVIDSPEVKEILTTRIIDSKFEAPLTIKKIELKSLGRISLTLSDIEIDYIKFNKYFAAKDSTFNLVNLKVRKIEFNHCVNIGEFTFANLIMPNDSELIINNSDLGKMSFFNSDIENSQLSFDSSKITGIFISRTEIPKTVLASNNELRSFYSQIKKVYETKGDLVTSSYFYSREMDSYSKSLNWGKDFGEKANVLLNKLSSNHGQSWLQGLCSSLTVCIIAYCVYLILLGFKLNIFHSDQGLFVKLWAYFFEFINPVHKADAIATSLGIKEPSSYAVLWEGFSRIPIAYFIYQLIQAFRKHGKK